MSEGRVVSYVINEPVELNLSYMPFIKGGGLFVPTMDKYTLGEFVSIDLQLPGKKDATKISGKVVWIIPANALHHVLPGIGIQFLGTNAATIRSLIESNLDSSMDIGGYTYGMMEEAKKGS